MKIIKISNGSQIWFKLCEMICEITIINFMKIKNNFNHFLVCCDMYLFHANTLQATII